jgi:hypothetical protein
VKNGTDVAPNKPVQLRGITTNRWAYTDSSGIFTAKVKKDEDIDVYLGYNTTPDATFRINNRTTDYTWEKSDDGTTVTLNDLAVVNQPPTAYAYLSSYSIKVGKTVTAYISAYDEEGDYPLSYSLTGGNAAFASGTIASGSSSVSAEFTPAAGKYDPVTLTVTDSKGNARTVNLGSLEVATGNRAPVTNLYADRYNIPSTDTTKQVTLYGNASDMDGDSLSYTWKVNSTTVSSGSAQGGYANSSYLFTVPSTAKAGDVFTIEFVVTDGTATVTKSVTITYGQNHAPTVTLAVDKTFVASGATGSARNVACTATGYDLDLDSLSYTWYVDNALQSGATGTSFTFTIPSTATLGQAFEIKVQVSDGAKTGTASRTITYGQAGDVTVVIQ